MSIWSEEDNEEMTLPDPETSLMYSLHYAQQGRRAGMKMNCPLKPWSE